MRRRVTGPGSSGPVICIDCDIVLRQVAGPEGCGGFALVETDGDFDLALHEDALRGLFGEIDQVIFAEDRNVAEIDLDSGRIELDTRVADGGEDPAPVRVFPVNCRLDEVGICDRPGGLDGSL